MVNTTIIRIYNAGPATLSAAVVVGRIIVVRVRPPESLCRRRLCRRRRRRCCYPLRPLLPLGSLLLLPGGHVILYALLGTRGTAVVFLFLSLSPPPPQPPPRRRGERHRALRVYKRKPRGVIEDDCDDYDHIVLCADVALFLRLRMLAVCSCASALCCCPAVDAMV